MTAKRTHYWARMPGIHSSFDVVIAGGGLIGLTSAWVLCDGGYRVAVVEAGAIGREASWAGGGILFPIYPWKYPAVVQRLAQRGRALYDAFTARVDACAGIDSENRRTGLHILDSDEAGAARCWARAHAEPIEQRSAADLADAQPGLMADSAVYFPHAAQVRNPRLCQSLRSALQTRGVAIFEHHRVQALCQSAGRFSGFQTDRGPIAAPCGVVATGAWSTALAGALCRVPVFPVKGQMILLQGRPGLVGSVLLQGGRYVIPRDDGRILVGSTVEQAGFSAQTDPDTAEALQCSAARMMPALGRLPIERQWAGLRPATADGCPLIGGLGRLPGLYLNTGHYRNGVVCAPASAELLVQCIQNGGVSSEAACDPMRLTSATSTAG